MEAITLSNILSLLNTLGALGLAVVFLMMFSRGDIISRAVYKDLTEHIIGEIMERVEETIRETVTQCLR